MPRRNDKPSWSRTNVPWEEKILIWRRIALGDSDASILAWLEQQVNKQGQQLSLDRKTVSKIRNELKDVPQEIIGNLPPDIQAYLKDINSKKSDGFLSIDENLARLKISPSAELNSFLKERARGPYWDSDRWGLAVDWHVILPGSTELIRANAGLWKFNVKINGDLDENQHKIEMAKTFGLTVNVIDDIVNSEPVPEQNRLKYYIHDIDESSGSIDSGSEIKFILGRTKYQVYRAINRAMENRIPALGNISLGDHIKTLNLPEPDGSLSRHAFMVRIGLHMAVITSDNKIVITRRKNGDITKNTWGLPVSESMKADVTTEGRKEQLPDYDFYDTAIRGLREELGVEESDKNKINIFAFTGEWNTLEFSIFAYYHSTLSAEQIKECFFYKKKDREEGAIQFHPLEMNAVLTLLKERNPSKSNENKFSPGGSRLMWLLVLMREFGVDKLRESLISI